MESLLAYINSLVRFTDENWRNLLPALSETQFKKGENLLKKDEICNSLFYICRGYCRAYHIKDGKEKNTDFFFENDIATNINSFSKNEASEFWITACEPLEVVRFDKKILLEKAQQDTQIESLGKKCLQLIAGKQEKRLAMYKLLTPLERYEYLEEHEPEILQRVSLSQLSSYLGVARETLSRIRKRRIK